MRRSAVIVAQAAVLALSVPASARVEVTAEAGPELDTNAHRVQPIVVPCPPGSTCVSGRCMTGNVPTGETCITTPEDPLVAGLMRVTATFRYGLHLGERHALTVGYGGGGKVFLADDARDADELVHRGSLGWASRFPRGAVLSLEGTFYDAYQRESIRDFRTGAGLARLALGRRRAGLLVSSTVGYRGLEYKPIDDYDFHGPLAGVDLSSSLQSGDEDELVEWNLRLSYWLGLRQFSGAAEGVPLPCPDRPNDLCNQPTTSGREDLNHLLRAEVNYLGNADATLWYTLEVNQSNSHGETFSRHIIGLKFTTPLVWGVYLTTKGVLQFSRFRDPYLISRIPNETFITIEDENRSRLILQLARDLTSYLSLNLRYALYVNESVTQAATDTTVRIPDFRRQTLFLGLRVEYSSQ